MLDIPSLKQLQRRSRPRMCWVPSSRGEGRATFSGCPDDSPVHAVGSLQFYGIIIGVDVDGAVMIPSWFDLWLVRRVVDLEPTKIKIANRELITLGIIDELSKPVSSIMQ